MWLGSGCLDGSAKEAARPVGECDPGRSQSPHSTDAARSKRVVKRPASKTGPREGGQEGGRVKDRPQQSSAGSADMSGAMLRMDAKQGAEARPMIAGAEAGVWTERMLSALASGVKGGKWFSLMDKVYAPKTLALAWTKVAANKGAAGVDGQSIKRFATKADEYLAELSTALREGTYQPRAVRRVDIPKGDGRTRPLGIPTVKDRIIQQAVRLVIEPIFENGFRDGSYGFRSGRGCHDALCRRRALSARRARSTG